MKITSFLVGPCLITLLVGCNDVSSNRKQGSSGNPERSIPTVEINNQKSFLHRDKGTTILSYADEIKLSLTNELPESVRTIPVMEKDDEGSTRNVTTVLSRGRPAISCGITGDFKDINARIADCSVKNGTKALWQGLLYGAGGEGNWNLVTRNDDAKEMWLDGRSGMVWSDIMRRDDKNVFNWCKASGNHQGVTTTELIDCMTLGENASLCDGTIFSEVGTQVKWRLPTRNDFLQADLNGLRFVLKKETNLGLWSSTMRAATAGRIEAWVYSSLEGTLLASNLKDERHVRCIGAPLRQ